MTPRTIDTLRQLGNVTHDDYAQAYFNALTIRCGHLFDLLELQARPWYDRLFTYRALKAMIKKIDQEQEFLNHCKESISWPLVNDQETAEMCKQFESLQGKLIRSPYLCKFFKHDE